MDNTFEVLKVTEWFTKLCSINRGANLYIQNNFFLYTKNYKINHYRKKRINNWLPNVAANEIAIIQQQE